MLSENVFKADRAEAVLAAGGVISVQVLNEFASVALRKIGLNHAEIRDILGTVRSVCQVRPLTPETHELGLNICERFGFSLYDSMIVGSAVEAGCAILYSEDMQSGRQINDQLVITNPFLS